MLVLIDNYDSFTFNLVQYFQQLNVEVEVIRNDQCTTREIVAKKPMAVVISPGPSDPDHAGISLGMIRISAEENIPLLGVCLGHQAIGQAFGGKVVRGTVPVHGKTAEIFHKGGGLFRSLPSPLQATRYHSLIVERGSLPSSLEVTAETKDGVIMALRHRTLPIEGVQFHPESVMTDHGLKMLENFLTQHCPGRPS